MATPNLTRLDPTSLDLTELDLTGLARSAASSTAAIAERATVLAKDATYVTVGFSVLGFQRARNLRRRFEQALHR